MASIWARRVLRVAIVLAALSVCVPVFAQTGGLTGRCNGPGNAPLVKYTIQLDRTEMKWTSKTKTDKKGEYIYIGLAPGAYKVSLIDPDGKVMFFQTKQVGLGDPTELNFDMGQIQQEAKKEQEANPEYQKAVEAQKQSAGMKQLFDQGVGQYNNKQYTDAAASFEKALPMAKDKNLLIIEDRLAETWTKEASVETSPDARKADQAKALDYYTKLIALAPNDAGLHNNLGSLYANMGRNADAVAEFKKAADIDPTHAGGYYYNLGAILVNQGQMNDAADALKKATDIDPTNSNAWYWYGMALLGKATVKADGTMLPAPGTVEAFQTYLKLAPTGQWAPQAQASLESLQGKESLEFKKTGKGKN